MGIDYAPGRVYGLAYLPARKGKDYPEIVLKTAYPVDSLFSRFPKLRQISAECKYSSRDGETKLRYALASGKEKVQATAYAISHTLEAFNDLLAEVQSGSGTLETIGEQLIEARTACSPNAAFHGHPLTGHLYPAMRKWLVGFAARDIPSGTSEFRTGLPLIVTKSMRSAWKSLAEPDMKRWRDTCGGNVMDDGRFLLCCFGNACDVSIYPDMDLGPNSEYPSEFGCHNLDSAIQQLTLLAGLASLHDFAAKELDSK